MTRRNPQQPPAAPNAASLKSASAPRRQMPYLFAYDIGDDRRARQVLRCLQRWRVDGQLSVHETELLPFQARELAAELLDYLDQRADSLLVCRLSRRGNAGPIHALACSPRHPQLVGRKTAVHTTGSLPGGWYLLAYDITDPARLQRIQRHAAKVCVYLQRSVYLYHGAGAPLASLLAILREEIRPGSDDMRLYYFAGPGDLWFPSGPLPPLAGLDGKGTGSSLWQRLMAWLGSG